MFQRQNWGSFQYVDILEYCEGIFKPLSSSSLWTCQCDFIDPRSWNRFSLPLMRCKMFLWQDLVLVSLCQITRGLCAFSLTSQRSQKQAWGSSHRDMHQRRVILHGANCNNLNTQIPSTSNSRREQPGMEQISTTSQLTWGFLNKIESLLLYVRVLPKLTNHIPDKMNRNTLTPR